MTYEPDYLKRWSLPRFYFGAEWPDYFSAGVGQSRDSDALERSNFRRMLELLNGETETVIVVRESHWAVGWIEWIAIHQSDSKALEIADDIKRQLEDYPVVDETDWSELEQQDADDLWRDCYTPENRIAYIRKHPDQFDFHGFADMVGCVRGRYFAGHASELLR